MFDVSHDKGYIQTCVYLLLSAIFYRLVVYIRNAYYHPLARFPGPPTAAISNFLYCYMLLRGRQPYDILDLHRRYGPVVRIAPNELSFNTSQSWKDIYGFRQSLKPFVKSDFYDGGSFADQAHSIVSERDPKDHRQMRKYLSNAFSERSLADQESLIAEIIDRFIVQIGGERGRQGVNMVQWFNMLTFDVIGSLAFGETFKGVETGRTHEWISLVTGALKQGALADTMKRFPLLAEVIKRLMPGKIEKLVQETKVHESYSLNLIKKRLANKTPRKDFVTSILENKDSDNISDIQLAAHASDFITAGSETAATALACITYYLLRRVGVGSRLRQEVRQSFQSYESINNASTIPLPYLNAVILEGMRIYPPLPFALPRVVPEAGDIVDGHFIPGGTVVSTNPVAASLSETNFQDPELFRPERWLEGNKYDNLDASQPFSLGARGCLGQSLAWMEMRTTLAKIHYSYDLELLSEDLDWHRDSQMHTLWIKPELRVRVTVRATS
ncbi:benzoate 4-monooxygenase cytochrome P450 [Hypoxylon rubiginosum]|uniref:Benzoate 4-monooxygenase cytochrome P450 n=1 Tax=Hypoxylon rubiginosum TaxID=110542 RepID=A0ACC0CWW0_9PEZI|nr:benzoate 4-monooxygenase cytochrome P450 [Hypoxylon rubiginosum]